MVFQFMSTLDFRQQGCFWISVIHLSFPSDFSDKLWVVFRDYVFLDKNVVPGSTIDFDPGTCRTWQNHGDRTVA